MAGILRFLQADKKHWKCVHAKKINRWIARGSTEVSNDNIDFVIPSRTRKYKNKLKQTLRFCKLV